MNATEGMYKQIISSLNSQKYRLRIRSQTNGNEKQNDYARFNILRSNFPIQIIGHFFVIVSKLAPINKVSS